MFAWCDELPARFLQLEAFLEHVRKELEIPFPALISVLRNGHIKMVVDDVMDAVGAESGARHDEESGAVRVLDTCACLWAPAECVLRGAMCSFLTGVDGAKVLRICLHFLEGEAFFPEVVLNSTL